MNGDREMKPYKNTLVALAAAAVLATSGTALAQQQIERVNA